jgi:thiol-disulfide isomerase/thioredoxin
MKKILFSVLFACIYSMGLFAQGYRIEVTIDGVKDSTLYIAMYSGTTKYAIDTAQIDGQGRAVFQKEKPLTGGMYLVAMGGMQLFDFLISDEKSQHFSIHTGANDYYGNLTFKNSPENTALIDFQRTLGTQQKKISNLVERSKIDTTLKTMVQDSVKIIEEYVKDYIKTNREKYEGKLLASILRAAFPVPTPAPDIPETAPKRDSLLWAYYYQYSKNHYLDNINFSDPRLIYTPVLKPHIEDYFNKIILQLPDSLIPQVDYVLRLSEANHEVYSSVLSLLFNKYVEADIMGMEKVAVHIGREYIMTGKADWLDSTAVAKIKEYVEHNQYSLIGMQAKDLKLQSLTGQFESIYDIQSPFLALVFYEPDCGHCQKEVPLIHEVYKKYKDKGLQVFAVYGEYIYDKWVKFVTENKLEWINVWDGYEKRDNVSVGSNFREYYNVYSTPQIYLLDKNRKIIGRRLNAEILEDILKHELGELSQEEEEKEK